MKYGISIRPGSFLSLGLLLISALGLYSPQGGATENRPEVFALPDHLKLSVQALTPSAASLQNLKLENLTQQELRQLARTLDDARIAPEDFRGARPTRLDRASRRRTFSDRDDYRLIFHWGLQDSPFPMTDALIPDESMNSRGQDLQKNGGAHQQPAAQFASHFAAWLSQPDYRCRLPIQAEWLASQFGPAPMQHVCKKMTYSFPLTSELGNTIEIDPNHVFEIQYVHAGVGQSVESRFGHAMFRVVQCASRRTILNADCRRDKANHVILSFRARTGGKRPGMIDGLTGAYPLELGVLRPSDIQDTYLENELRSIEWLPLRMSRAQIRRFVQRGAEIAWSVEGDYKFLTRNCADDALRLLIVALNDSRLLHPRSDVLSPSGLRDFLVETGLVEVTQKTQSHPLDKSLAVFFERLKIAAVPSGFAPISIRDYLKTSLAIDRRKTAQYIAQALQSTKNKGSDKHAAALKLGLEAWLILEPYCRKRVERELIAEWSTATREALGQAAEKYEEAYLNDRIHSGFGIPSDPQVSEKDRLRHELLGPEFFQQASAWIQKKHPERVREIQTSLEAQAETQSTLFQN